MNRHRMVRRKALKRSDLDWLVLILQNARTFTEHFRRTHARTACAQDVCRQDGPRGSAWIVRPNLTDKQRHIDVGGTGLHTRCVVTEQTPVGLGECFVLRQRRAKLASKRFFVKTLGHHVGEISTAVYLTSPKIGTTTAPFAGSRLDRVHRVSATALTGDFWLVARPCHSGLTQRD